MIIEIRIRKDENFGRDEYSYQHVIDKVDLERFVLPNNKPVPGDFYSMTDYMQKMEQQKRYVDMISAKIAYAMTDYMINRYWKERNHDKYTVLYEKVLSEIETKK